MTELPNRRKDLKPPRRMEYIPGKVLIKIAEGAVMPHVGPRRMAMTAASAGAVPETISGPVEYLRKNMGLKRLEPVFSTRQNQLRGTSLALSARASLAAFSSVADSTNEDLRGINIADVDPRKVTPAAMKALRGSKAVQIVEPMPARWTAAADPMQNRQWGLSAIDWFNAALPGDMKVVVGVMDTGIDMTHPDLKGVVKDYYHAGLSSKDLLGHGTHVAGIIAALVNNGAGISGVAPCQLAVWKIFDDKPHPIDGEFYVNGDNFIRALGAARNAGIRVLNLSIGGTAKSQTEALLFDRLTKAGVLVVAAMGNEYQEGNPTSYPAAYPTVCAVGAVDETLRRSPFSNTGKHIALAAPGSSILSTLPMKSSPHLHDTEYAAWDGTSMATPFVSAVAAMIAEKNPTWGPVQVRDHLTSTARKLPAMKKKKVTPSFGAGLLDVAKALT